MIVVYIDGLAEPTNPGIGSYGYVIYNDGIKVKEDGKFVGEYVSNNMAEYSALCEALKTLLEMGLQHKPVIVRSDSKLLVNQMLGKWKTRDGLYIEKYREAIKLAAKFPKITFEWIPREQNKEADSLSRKAYIEYQKQKWKKIEN